MIEAITQFLNENGIPAVTDPHNQIAVNIKGLRHQLHLKNGKISSYTNITQTIDLAEPNSLQTLLKALQALQPIEHHGAQLLCAPISPQENQ